MMKKPIIETVLTPALFDLYNHNLHEKNVVVIDILRATTTMCVAFENGAEAIIPTATPEEAAEFKKEGWLAAAERNGITVEGFDCGNSPQEYTRECVMGKKIAITTTNGTRALKQSKGAAAIYVGSFINLNALCNRLKQDKRDIILFCAGWKDKINLEDTLFAGAVISELENHFEVGSDASHIALDLYNAAKPNLTEYLQKASHVHRFQSLHIESDLEACLKTNVSEWIPVYDGEKITTLRNETNSTGY